MEKIEKDKPLTKEEKQKLIKDTMEKRYPEHGSWFRVGDVIIIQGLRFRIKNVKPTELRLKLLPKPKGSNNETE